MAPIEIGSEAPRFTLPNQDGKDISLSDFTGKNVLIWFVPRAFGGNWTREASGFRDRIQNFQEKNTQLLGITFSFIDELKRWSDEVGFNSHLLCDETRSVAIAYGAALSADQERATRLSVLISPDGNIRKIYLDPDAGTHPDEVLLDLN